MPPREPPPTLTAGPRPGRAPRRALPLVGALLASCAGPAGDHALPNPAAAPVNQLAVSGNACGPAALLYAFAAGSPAWQRAHAAVPGTTDRERITWVIRRYALQPSRHLPGHRRWSPRGGIGVADLADMADEMTRGHSLPGTCTATLVAGGRLHHRDLLRRLHEHLATSFQRGLPPLLALKRMERSGAGWSVVDGHFIVVSALPERLPHDADRFEFGYFDPHGARHRRATVHIPADPSVPWLEADCPDTPVGRRRVPAGRETHVSAAAVIGRF